MNALTRLLALVALAFGVLAYSSPSALSSSGTMTITTSTTLSEDHFGSIIVAGDNVTLDCAGHTVHGDGSHGDGTFDGIVVSQRSGVTVKRCTAIGFGAGVFLYYSTRSTVRENTLIGNYEGAYVEGGDHNSFVNNQLQLSGGYGGIDVWFSPDAVLLGNREVAQASTYGSQFGFRLAASPRGQLRLNHTSGNGSCGYMAVLGSDDSTFSWNTSAGDGVSFYVAGSNGVAVNANNIDDGVISVFDASSISIAGNTLQNAGIMTFEAESVLVAGNRLTGSRGDGIRVDGGRSHIIRANDVRAGQENGISLLGVDLTELSANVSTGNLREGVLIANGSTRVTAAGNASIANGASGFFVAGSDNLLRHNTALLNKKYGFIADLGATGNTFAESIGLRNGVDAADMNPPGANTWIGNRFVTTWGLT